MWGDLIEPVAHFLQVSTGYVESDAPDALRIRNRDLLPPGEPVSPIFDLVVDRSVAEGKRSASEAAAYEASLRDGHADRFLQVIEGELHPILSKRFQIDETRSSLFGYSFGGLFTTWAGPQKSTIFPIFGASSPGMLMPTSMVFTELEAQAKQGARHDGRALHMTVNDLEMLRPTFDQMLGENFVRFDAAMSRSSLGLKFSSEIINGESHYSSLIPAWPRFPRGFYSLRRPSSQRDASQSSQ